MANLRRWMGLLLALLPLFPVCSSSRSLHHHRQHAVEISNESDQKIAIDWYNPLTHDVIAFGKLREGESIQVNSFTNHTFLVHYDNETCADQYCRSTTIVVKDDAHQGTFD